MKIDESAYMNVHTSGGGENPPSVGLTPGILPEAQGCVSEESSQTGVSTQNAPPPTDYSTASARPPTIKRRRPENISHWYALRCTYGREQTAYDKFVSKGITAFYPTINTVKLINGKRKTVTESRLPNIFFAYGTENQLKTFVYDNVNFSYLRFYYHHVHIGNKTERTPLIVPDYQMESLRIVCAADADDIIVSPEEIQKFEEGELVRVVKGKFAGFIGRVARYKGQQRVGIVIGKFATAATAYVPNAFLEKIEEM